MADYQRMYSTLCGAVSDAIDLLADDPGAAVARRLLEQAMQHAEEIYLNTTPPAGQTGNAIRLFPEQTPPAKKEL